MFIEAPKAANCSAICKANSLVGVNTRPKIPIGSSDHLVSIGAANAMVLPEPVLAPPIQSWPDKMAGIQAF
ncbi:hypothetical protein WICPIJ_002397 [Wickerhamomyces pijperi]|uniref:Uncharacterized protein n=1 Tax=Wickerhamomyces pijperi TaxID=599730 RepID=A0A9P8Q9U6_WICPI|nr:hypothetical protein WICPIJ_002397 [Wickerhamomyces pijperi]